MPTTRTDDLILVSVDEKIEQFRKRARAAIEAGIAS